MLRLGDVENVHVPGTILISYPSFYFGLPGVTVETSDRDTGARNVSDCTFLTTFLAGQLGTIGLGLRLV